MQSRGILDHVDLAVEDHLGKRRGAFQVAVLQLHGIGEQRLVALDEVGLRVALGQHLAEFARRNQLLYLEP